MAVFPILTTDSDTILTADGFAIVVGASATPTTRSQVITKGAYQCNYGSATGWISLFGPGDVASTVTFGIDYAKVPVSVAGTFKNLVVYAPTTHPTFTLTLYKNGTATTMAAVVSSAASTGSDVVHSVTVAAGDDVVLQLTGVLQPFPGYPIGLSLGFDSDTGASSYGVPPFSGSVTNGVGRIGGALGNGNLAEIYNALTANSLTYSISALAGTLTRLDARTYSGAPGAGTWTAYVRKNGVLQDGTGGTVNTACLITGTDTQQSSTFTLPIAIQDHVDTVVLRGGSDAAFANAQVGCSVAFLPTVDGAWMLCGGNNDALDTTNPGWRWVGVQQLATPESSNAAPIGPTALAAQGLYVEYSAAPNSGTHTQQWTSTLRNSGADTTLSVVVADTATSGLVTGSAFYSPGETVDIQLTPANTPRGARFYWGLALFVSPPSPTPPATVTYPVRRLRRFMLPWSLNYQQFISRLEIQMQVATALVDGQGSDPIVMLRLSPDGGMTWGGEIQMNAGRIGAYLQRVYVNRLSRARQPVAEISTSDPVLWGFLACLVDIEEGTN